MAQAPWTVVCFAGVDWEAHWQRPQALMTALAERGASVLYVDNLGTRLPSLRDAPRVARRLKSRLSSGGGGRTGAPRLRVDSPVVLPFQQYRAVRAFDGGVLLRRIRRRIVPRRPLIVWTYSPLPVIADVAAELRADVLLYDWADDASQRVLTRSHALRTRLARWEDEMARRADLVFVASAELLRRRGKMNPLTYLVPHGVNKRRASGEAPEVARLPRPRIGFVGSISEWIDVDLLEGLARSRPQWSFVLVGPARVPLRRLAARPNVLVVGARPHEEVPAFLSGFDAALIPYRRSPATTAASPVKLREYLAYGLPVVSVDIPEAQGFGPSVAVASGVDGFLGALERILSDDASRRPRVPSRTWADAVEEMIDRVDQVLASRRANG